jgi:hypothetical protein
VPVRELAKRYPGLSPNAFNRHSRVHLMQMLAKAKEADEVVSADAILDRLKRLEKRMWGILDRSEKDKEFVLTVQAAREIRGCLELCARLHGTIQDKTVINVVNLPEFVIIQRVLLVALEGFPEARTAVAKALADAETLNRAAAAGYVGAS